MQYQDQREKAIKEEKKKNSKEKVKNKKTLLQAIQT